MGIQSATEYLLNIAFFKADPETWSKVQYQDLGT